MILVPETPITENSFEKWKCHKIDVTEDDGMNFHYWVIPLIEMDESEMENIEFMPSIYSCASANAPAKNQTRYAKYTMPLSNKIMIIILAIILFSVKFFEYIR